MRSPRTLPFHEWLIILLFCTILIVLALLAFGKQQKAPILPPPSEQLAAGLQVRIEGEIVNPGLYHFPSNTTLKELIDKAQPLETADLSTLNWRRKLRDGQIIRIPKKRLITITIEGAVENPGAMQILSGTRCQEIVDLLQALPEAELSGLRKKRTMLRQGDVVIVPIKSKSFENEKNTSALKKRKKKGKARNPTKQTPRAQSERGLLHGFACTRSEFRLCARCKLGSNDFF